MKSKSATLRKTLKFSSALALLFVFGVITRHVSAATKPTTPPALVLHAPGQDFNIDAQTLDSWRAGQPQNYTTYSFAPAPDLTTFLKQSLGQQQSYSHIYFSSYDLATIFQYLKSIQPQIDKPTEEPVYKEQDGRVTDFNPGQDGVTLDVNKSLDAIIAALDKNNSEVQLASETTHPLTQLADLNNRGIKELIAAGTSNYAGSPANRIFNIKVGVQKETGTLLAPGEEFSFNKYLGPVDGEHGFLPELVIKSNETIPEFGGGLCQVSSTTFRAAVNAGLPITERRNHSYAVQYYAPQGTDATIYPGSADLKFVNNTSAYILVWAWFPAKNKLEFDLYGTKDSRQVALDGPYSYDRKPDGSLKAVWYRTTTMPDGQVVKDAFKSNYLPPALFHKSTTATTPSPTTTTPPATAGQATPPANPTT